MEMKMTITSRRDWIEMARQALQLIPSYAEDMRTPWNAEAAQVLFDAAEYKQLHGEFQLLWERLPDDPSIRCRPFGDLCELCSGAWALGEKENPRFIA